MKRLIYLFFACMCFGAESALFGMVSRVPVSKTGITSNKSASSSTRQIHPAMLKGAHGDQFASSPVVGALVAESCFLKNLFLFGDQQSPTVRLLRDIYHIQDGVISPTRNFSKPAASLTVSRVADMHSTIGENLSSSACASLIEVWKKDHHQVTGAKLSHARFQRFFDLVRSAAYESEKGGTLPDMVPLIASAFVSQKMRTIQDVEQYCSALEGKKEIGTYSGSVSDDFEDFLRSKFFTNTRVMALNQAEDFERTAVSLMIRKNYASVLVPPPVDRTIKCGYKGQEARPTCQEASIRDLINILVYDPKLKEYSYSRLPYQEDIHPSLKAFYAAHKSPIEHNTQHVAQAWMDIVSGLPDVSYELGSGDARYELSGTIDTVFNLVNHLVCSSKARNWDELGKRLSDETRTVSFALTQRADEKLENRGIVTIKIQSSKQEVPPVVAYLHAHARHGTLEVPLRTVGNEITTKESVFTWDLYGSLLKRALGKQSFFEKWFMQKPDSVSQKHALLILPFVRALAFDTSRREGMHTLITDNEYACYADMPFAYQQYYLLARSLEADEQRARAIADGCALLTSQSTELAAQIARLCQASSGSFNGCLTLLHGVVRRYAEKIVQHDALANAVAACMGALCDHAKTPREMAVAVDEYAFYTKSALGKHHSAEKIFEKLQSIGKRSS